MRHYLLMPGYVYEAEQKNYVSAVDLAHLYHVSMSECFVHDSAHPTDSVPEGLIQLRPRIDGNYSLPQTWTEYR